MSKPLPAPPFVVLIAAPAFTMEQALRIKRQFEQMHVGTTADIAENRPGAPAPEVAPTKLRTGSRSKPSEVLQDALAITGAATPAPSPTPETKVEVAATATAVEIPTPAPVVEPPFNIGDRLRDKYAPHEVDVIAINQHTNHFLVERVSDNAMERTKWPVPFASADCYEKISRSAEVTPATEEKSSVPAQQPAPSGEGQGAPAAKVAPKAKRRPKTSAAGKGALDVGPEHGTPGKKRAVHREPTPAIKRQQPKSAAKHAKKK